MTRTDSFPREVDVPAKINRYEPERKPRRTRRKKSAAGQRSRRAPSPDAFETPPALAGKPTKLTIVAQDPSIPKLGEVPLLTTVKVPAERVLPGPRDHRFFVVDYDPSAATVVEPVSLTDDIDGERDRGWRLVDRFDKPKLKAILFDRAFHAQNVYAVAVSLLARFEEVLGRRVAWGFGSHHLYLVPHAFIGANAGYSPDDHSIAFGYLPPTGATKTPVLTCLSHDVIAHELTHAILDGLRPRYIEPGLPDQMAFHEGFADIVALLAVFSRSEAVARIIGGDKTDEFVDEQLFKLENLEETALFGIGEELGATLDPSRRALRRSLSEVPEGGSWRKQYYEPHQRGEVLVAAIAGVVATIWLNRLKDLLKQGQVPLLRAAQEGAKVAEQVLGMCIRALDYLPPIEFEFEDFLDAILAADEVVVPDDERGYRTIVEERFKLFDIKRPVGSRIASNQLAHPWRYQGTNYKSLATSPDEVFRFLWQNADNFGISLDYYLDVERVLSVTRTGPDGLVVEEIIADYTQTITAPLRSFPAAWRQDVDAPLDTEVQVWGGGVVAFDQYGLPRHHVTKPLLDGQRQQRRLKHLAAAHSYDTRKRLGFSYGVSSSAQFQMLHTPKTIEGW